ncbi:DUF445 family protein [Cupriavidus sp. WKF15]|uniref:DUF445 domain-containing protein n=1 Tax=Cupriavidus sp. WKF15 TaxID=3032282 RepID=UPI0023E20B83|nr:DUF445 family protein [Cupriavidus sp. WKF15]WER47799.1 DUF445 family protein [Cupriavidus sp. WKF15]
MTQELELRNAKHKALALLLAATLVFAITIFLPHGFATDWVRSAAEAAMVGGMADWFAVAALFRRIPVPGLAGHTNIIIRKRDDIADGLAVFVKEKFLDVNSVVALIDKHNPAQVVADWLDSASNTRRMGDAVARFARSALDLMDEKTVQAFAKDAVDAMIDQVDLTQSAAGILETLTRDNRHQALLRESITHLVELLKRPDTRDMIAGRIAEWLKLEHPYKEKVLPTEWISGHGAEMISAGLSRVLTQVEKDDGHELRRKFDEVTKSLIKRLKEDASFRAKADDIKRYLREHPAFNAYIGELWTEWKERLKTDLAREDSAIYRKVAGAGQWIGEELARNESLRQALNQHLRDAARAMAPDFADFITRHISNTVRSWDAKDMSRQIELNVGRDLQYIRMNGTIVGGLIGATLYLLAQAPALIR